MTLRAPVSRVAWGGPRVTLETPQGTVEARAAILTVSTAVLAGGAIRFDPALPDWKLTAIEAVPMGAANKIAFAVRRDVFGDPAGRFSIFSSDKADAMHFHVRPCGDPVVGAYVGGRVCDALEKDGPEAMKALALERLKAIFGADIEKEITGSVATGWRGDPVDRRRLFVGASGPGAPPRRPGDAARRAAVLRRRGDAYRLLLDRARRLFQRRRRGGEGGGGAGDAVEASPCLAKRRKSRHTFTAR